MTWIFLGLLGLAVLAGAFAVWASAHTTWYNAYNRWVPSLVSVVSIFSLYGVMGKEHAGECLRHLCKDVDSTTDYLGQYIVGGLMGAAFGFAVYIVCSMNRSYQITYEDQDE